MAAGTRLEKRQEGMCTSVSFLVLLSSDPDPIILFTAGSGAEINSLFHPGLQSLTSLTEEGRHVFFLACCTVVTEVLTEAEQPPEYAAERFIELKWRRSYQKINS